MVLSNIRIEKEKSTCKLCMDVEYNNKTTTLWYEVDKIFEKYLCTELADAFLVALLLFAMEKNENIKIETVPVSDLLLFNIKEYLIPSIAKNIKKYNYIDIISNTSNIEFKGKKNNGTGISRGIDSFYTINEYTKNCPSDMKIDCLTFFNIGAHGTRNSEKAYELFKKRMVLSEDFAKKNNFKFLSVNSNISEFISQDFQATHTFRNLSIVFALQKLFKNYYYSSGITVDNFSLSGKDTASYDIYIMYLLSTKNIKFYSSGASMSRIEKTKIVANYSPSYDYLSVCFRDDCNCGKCEKCIRTIFEFYADNNLKKFNKVFDLNFFYKHKNWYERKFFEFYFRGIDKLDYMDTYNELKLNNIKIKKRNILVGFLVAKAKKIYYLLRG